MLAASPAAKGLFHRAISESGGSFAPVRSGNEAAQMGVHSYYTDGLDAAWVPALKMAEAAGKSYLEGLGANDINAARALTAEKIQSSAGGTLGRFWPVADGYVLPGDQYEIYQAGRFNDTPVLIGTNSDESALFIQTNAGYIDILKAGFQKVTPASFEQQVRADYGPHADAILKTYPHATDREALKAAKDMFRESAFSWHTWSWARLQSQKGKGKAYVYYFDRKTPVTSDGASHGSEVSFVFANPGVFSGTPQPGDAELTNLMQTYWVNFAKSGDPNGPGLPPWPVFTEAEQKTMFFDANSSARPIPNLDKLKAHDGYYTWRREEARQRSKVTN
jgi:para-nitrobenzyl esterase